jgi:tol-pal system protein YbgF
MRFKTVFAAGLLLAGSAVSGFASQTNPAFALPGVDAPLSSAAFIPVPKSNVANEAPVLLAQASTQQLEEQIRLLNGKVEEMNFLVLQLQEQMRKMQEDNEFRFQEVEKSKQGKATPKDDSNDVAASGAAEVAPAEPSQTEASGGSQTTGEPEKTLGAIKLDDKGNPIGATVEDVIEDNGTVAALPEGGSAEDIYRVAYDHVLAGEYGDAESGFRSHIEQFPKDKQTADARYWLGESLAGQDKHREAAEILLDAQRDYPKAKKAPDMLLKLGVSLAALDNKDVACATFAQISKKYPKAGPTLVSRVAEEQAKAGC